MEDIFDCWVDGSGAVLTQTGQGVSVTQGRDPVLDSGFAHLSWNDDGVTVRYAPDRVHAGALSGTIRQTRQIKRPVKVQRHVAGDWESNELATGSAAAEVLKAESGK